MKSTSKSGVVDKKYRQKSLNKSNFFEQRKLNILTFHIEI